MCGGYASDALMPRLLLNLAQALTEILLGDLVQIKLSKSVNFHTLHLRSTTSVTIGPDHSAGYLMP